jgi:hypothetical protein
MHVQFHNSKQSQECIQASQAKRLPHPVSSPYLAPSDFCLFGYVKEKLTAFHCTTRDELKSAIITIVAEIDREPLLAVFHSWLEWLEWAMKRSGESFNKSKGVQHFSFETHRQQGRLRTYEAPINGKDSLFGDS